MWPINSQMFRLLIFHTAGVIFVSAMSDVLVELHAPRYVVHRHSAVLRCDHNVDPDHLYKVVFFKHGHRIMQFVAGREPPFVMYNVSGAEINLDKVTPTSITLEKMDFSATGPYACEIALETPLYSKVSKIHEITVMIRQKHRPRIKIKSRRFMSNDVLEAACQSAPAHPAPHLTWFINNIKVDESYTTPHGTVNVHRHHHNVPLSITNSSLRYPLSELKLIPNQTVDVSCVSTIPGFLHSLTTGFADIQNYTIAVNVVRVEPAPTQLPVKIVSLLNKNSSWRLQHQNALLLLILPLKFCL